MADLTPRIDKLVGGLAGGRRGETQRPAGGSAPELRPGDAGFGDVVARLVSMPLDRFAREGQLLEVRVPWLDTTLWFVPEERDAATLGREGVSRGRVWTASELKALMAPPDRTLDVMRTVAAAKLAIDGDIAGVRPAGPRAPSAPAGCGRRPEGARGGQR